MDFFIDNQFAISFIISLVSSVAFIGWQRKVYKKNVDAIEVFKRFFSKTGDYRSSVVA